MVTNRYILASMFIFLSNSPLYANDDNTSSARLKVVDRDWEYFKTIPCQDLDKIVVYSDAENKLLDRKKNECIQQYKAFIPKSGPKP